MQVPYLKMHGTGNLILVVDSRAQCTNPPGTEQLRELGDATTGPGFDQLMWIIPANNPGCIAGYRVFNADGSEVEQCGNGVRCVARYLADNEDPGNAFTLESPAGPVEALIHPDGQVSVSMGTPVFDPGRIPFVADTMADTYEICAGETSLTISAVSMGNPHAVLQVADVESAGVGELGPLLENHERYPEQANVGFNQVIDRQHIRLRVFERGVGETAACGTGACAAVVTGQRLGLLDDEVSVKLPGGEVVVSWHGGDAPVWLKGNAELINQGTMDLQE